MKKPFLYRFLKEFVRLVYPRYTLKGTENLPEGPCILAGNHAQIAGPVISQLYLPGENYTWCAGEMFHLKEVPAYARKDFWGHKPAWTQPFFWCASYLIAPLCVFVFGNADTIPVYRDARVMQTFKETTGKLEEGARVVIFPEGHHPHNHVVAEFQQGFVDVARNYSRKTGEELPFVPVYISPSLHRICFGKPVYSDRNTSRKEEQQRISEAMMSGITELAMQLPPHIVIPYENVSKNQYPMSR